MRIIRGKYKTRRFKAPKNFPSRPTTDFAKEGLFNILEHQYAKDDMRILDLCAGTGSISFEFLSREWGNVTAVDKNFNCYKHVKSVAHSLECTKDIQVFKADILKFLGQTNQQYDIIIADPPYAYEHHAEIAKLVFERDLLAENGVLVIEHGKQTSVENITHFQFMRIYGGVCFSFFEKNEE